MLLSCCVLEHKFRNIFTLQPVQGAAILLPDVDRFTVFFHRRIWS